MQQQPYTPKTFNAAIFPGLQAFYDSLGINELDLDHEIKAEILQLAGQVFTCINTQAPETFAEKWQSCLLALADFTLRHQNQLFELALVIQALYKTFVDESEKRLINPT